MRKFTGMLCLALIGGSIGCTTTSEVSQYEAALSQATTCEDVLDAVQEDAIAKVELELESFVNQEYYNRGGGPVAFEDSAQGGSGGAGGSAAPTVDGDNGAEAPTGFSDTNRQVGDVDEADIVKVGAEGLELYVIRGNGFYEFDSWPASQLSKVADLEIEGGAMEMFVQGDRAVVFSNAYGVEALDDGDLCQGYYGGGPEPGLADIDGYYYCGRSFVKITVIDLSGEAPEALREVYVDGWYTSSRRHGSIVRAVVQSSMQRPGTVPYLYDFLYNGETYPETREAEILLARAWAVKAEEAIRATALKDWVPVWGERVDGEIQEQPVQCSDFYSPAPGLTNYGLTQIVGLDIETDSDTQITSILGQASQVYANGEAMVLTQPDWTFFERGVNSDRTAVHRFAVSFDQQRTPYQGSGFVQGTVNDQFSIDERGGIIRIATTRTTWPNQSPGGVAPDVWVPPTTDNLVSTLKLVGNSLELAGSTPPLAEGERIFSARFIGDLAYIVTFRQVDPLFAIDLSNPESPKVLGELKIPGFSDYMHPLGDDHLLTIGRDVDEVTQRDNGTALQIFDVSDPVNPMLAHKALVGEGYSEANHNHKAFNFYADKGLLAFPFVSYEGNFSSTLELWDVSATNGFGRRGAVDHSDLLLDDCGGIGYPVDEFFYQCGYQPQVTRGVFISGDDQEFIYSISHGGVRVHDVDDLSAPVATATY
ncbi:MAG: beta-propeller domain-containing protein [Deltaproteobacteria bacterium]|nr:beta-propeller domain-containing protein [Deltaproteobacteria bacterium]